ILLGHRTERQLALLAHRHKTQIQLVSQHRPQNKAARINARHQVQPVPHIAINKQIDQHSARTRILQYRSNIAESDAGLGPVGIAKNRVAYINSESNMDVKRQDRRMRERSTAACPAARPTPGWGVVTTESLQDCSRHRQSLLAG